MSAQTHNLKEHKSGDWWNGLVIPSITRNGSVVDLTGAIITFQAKKSASDKTPALEAKSDGASPTITTDGTNIVVAGRIVALQPRTYVYDIEIKFPSGSAIKSPKTWVTGEWPIVTDVTRRVYA